MNKPGNWPLSRRRVLQVSAAALVAAETLQISGAGLSSTASAQVVKTSIAGYILKRLTERKVKALFAVPGATCDRLLRAAVAQSFPIVATSSDLEAGQAADAYARIAGLGAVTVSYGVGTLALLPAIAGAYAERSPVVVLNGGPSAADLKILADDGTLPTHSIGRGLTDLRAFEQVTAKAIRIERARDAGKLMSRSWISAKALLA